MDLGRRRHVSECVMWFCVKTYTARMRNGVLTEDMTSFWPDVNETLLIEPSLQDKDDGIPSDFRIKNFTIKPPDQDTTYSIDSLTLYKLRDWMSLVSDQLIFTTDIATSGSYFPDLAEIFYNAQKITVNGSSILTGPEEAIARIARLMTGSIRNAADPVHFVSGVAKSARIFVSARWWGAVLPVALIVLTFGFMASTILVSIRNGIPVWKSSSLAVLVHGLDESTTRDTAATKLEHIEDNAERCKMAMMVDGERRKLNGRLNDTISY